jgi:hypothetical protein
MLSTSDEKRGVKGGRNEKGRGGEGEAQAACRSICSTSTFAFTASAYWTICAAVSTMDHALMDDLRGNDGLCFRLEMAKNPCAPLGSCDCE